MPWWDHMFYWKPEWEEVYEQYEYLLIQRTKLSKEQLREVVRLFKEYKILAPEGKPPE